MFDYYDRVPHVVLRKGNERRREPRERWNDTTNPITQKLVDDGWVKTDEKIKNVECFGLCHRTDWCVKKLGHREYSTETIHTKPRTIQSPLRFDGDVEIPPTIVETNVYLSQIPKKIRETFSEYFSTITHMHKVTIDPKKFFECIDFDKLISRFGAERVERDYAELCSISWPMRAQLEIDSKR